MSVDLTFSVNSQPLETPKEKIEAPKEKKVVPYVIKNDIPESLVGQALRWGAKNNWLNPSNSTLSKYSIIRNLGKAVRTVARLVYAVGVTTLLPFIGFAYHALGGIIYRPMAVIFNNILGNKDRAEHHKKCFLFHLAGYSADLFPILALGTVSLAASVIFATGGWRAAATANCFLGADLEPLSGPKSNKRFAAKIIQQRQDFMEKKGVFG